MHIFIIYMYVYIYMYIYMYKCQQAYMITSNPSHMLCTFALVPDDSTRIWENEWLPWGQGLPLHAISVRCPSLIDRLLLQHVPNRVKWSNYIWLNCSNAPTFTMRRWYQPYPTIIYCWHRAEFVIIQPDWISVPWRLLLQEATIWFGGATNSTKINRGVSPEMMRTTSIFKPRIPIVG